jgi:hypothetical protein
LSANEDENHASSGSIPSVIKCRCGAFIFGCEREPRGGANENAPGAAATQDSSQTGVEMIVRVNMISGDVKRLQRLYEEAFNFKTESQGAWMRR